MAHYWGVDNWGVLIYGPTLHLVSCNILSFYNLSIYAQQVIDFYSDLTPEMAIQQALISGDYYLEMHIQHFPDLSDAILSGDFGMLSNLQLEQNAEGILLGDYQIRIDIKPIALLTPDSFNAAFGLVYRGTAEAKFLGEYGGDYIMQANNVFSGLFDNILISNTQLLANINITYSLTAQIIRIAVIEGHLTANQVSEFEAIHVHNLVSDLIATLEEYIKGRMIVDPLKIEYWQIRNSAVSAVLSNIKSDTLTGTVDGSNTVFNTTEDYTKVLLVFVNGQTVTYTETGDNEITLDTAPSSGSVTALIIGDL